MSEIPATQIGTKDRSVGWYDPPLDTVDEAIQALLQEYSGIPADEVIPRIIAVVSSSPPSLLFPQTLTDPTPQREKLWDIFPWPCIGQFRFLDLSLRRQPLYHTILSRLQSGDRLLDVGCCMAQDLRALVRDGAPAGGLFGLEKEGAFLEIGYDFFGDRDRLGVRFIYGDLLDRDGEEMKDLVRTFGIVQLGMVLHIWDWEGQVRACERAVELLRDEAGVLVVGQSVGSSKGRAVPARGRDIFKHDPDTFAAMWEEVGKRTGTNWRVRAVLVEFERRSWDEEDTRKLSFEVERV